MSGEIESANTQMAELQLPDWAGLPTDILSLIIKGFFPHEITRVQSVCRAWKSIPSPTHAITRSQWLMTIGSNNMCTFFHPNCNESYDLEIPELSGATIYSSKNGWVLISRDGQNSVFFFNPFTRKFIKLPNLPKYLNLTMMTFTSSPTQADCMVFGIYVVDEAVLILTISRGEVEWKPFFLHNNSHFDLAYCNAVFHGGMFYCLGKDGNLGVFDPKTSTWNVRSNPTCPPSIDSVDSIDRSFLVECNGELIAVFLGFLGEWIHVFKLDSAKMTWERVDSLGDQMLFVSNTTSLSSKRVIQGMENKIYLPRIKKRSPIFYPIGREISYHAFGQHSSQKDFYGTGECVQLTWIEPDADAYSDEELKWATFDHDSSERPFIDIPCE